MVEGPKNSFEPTSPVSRAEEFLPSGNSKTIGDMLSDGSMLTETFWKSPFALRPKEELAGWVSGVAGIGNPEDDPEKKEKEKENQNRIVANYSRDVQAAQQKYNNLLAERNNADKERKDHAKIFEKAYGDHGEQVQKLTAKGAFMFSKKYSLGTFDGEENIMPADVAVFKDEKGYYYVNAKNEVMRFTDDEVKEIDALLAAKPKNFKLTDPKLRPLAAENQGYIDTMVDSGGKAAKSLKKAEEKNEDMKEMKDSGFNPEDNTSAPAPTDLNVGSDSKTYSVEGTVDVLINDEDFSTVPPSPGESGTSGKTADTTKEINVKPDERKEVSSVPGKVKPFAAPGLTPLGEKTLASTFNAQNPPSNAGQNTPGYALQNGGLSRNTYDLG